MPYEGRFFNSTNEFGDKQKEGCFGVAHTAMHAMLLGADGFEQFVQRRKIMQTTEPALLDEQIKAAEQKRLLIVNKKLDEPLTEEEQILLGIRPYSEAVEIFQRTFAHPELFAKEETPVAQNAKLALALVASAAVQPIANESSVFTGSYQQADLEIYCQSLRELCEQKHDFQYPALILTSGDHAITLAYDNDRNECLLVDPAQKDPKRISDNAVLAQTILSAFSKNDVAIFSTTAYSRKVDQAACQQFIEQWREQPSMQQIHTVNQKNATKCDSQDESWIHVAVQSGDVAKVPLLLAAGANPKACFSDGSSLLKVSVQNGHESITRILIDAGAKPEQSGLNGAIGEIEGKSKIPHLIGFGTEEHEAIGRASKILDVHGKPLAELIIHHVDGDKLTEPHATLQHVTFAQLVGSPDYFGLAKGSISNYTDVFHQTNEQLEKRFIEAFNQLAIAPHLELELEKIDQITREAKGDIDETVEDVICCGKSYLTLLKENYDHFAPDAWFAYRTGHQLALKWARIAHSLMETNNPEEAEKYLETAYALEGFACHFVSDNFSAGHMRTPRRALVNLFGSDIGGVLSNSMHDEDNANGINVINFLGDEWLAYGDGNLNGNLNYKNKKIVIYLVQKSVDEIYSAFQTGQELAPDNFVAKKLLPKAAEDISFDLEKPYRASGELNPSHMPLFKVQNDGKVYVRRELKNIACTEYHELTKLKTLIVSAQLRMESNHTARQQEAKESGQEVTLSQEALALTVLKEDVSTVLNKYANYSVVKTLFYGAKSSHNASAKFLHSIDSCSSDTFPIELYHFIRKNKNASRLMADLATPIEKLYESLNQGHTKRMRTPEAMLTYLVAELAVEGQTVEEPIVEEDHTSASSEFLIFV